MVWTGFSLFAVLIDSILSIRQVRIQRGGVGGGDRGSGPPWKITSYMGFPGKSWTPLENVGPPLEP